jgi:hypothetical protein
MFPVNTTRRSNFPTRPARITDTNSFPEDLFSDGKNLGMRIQFVNYKNVGLASLLSTIGIGANFAIPRGGISLPIPKKINDNQIITWKEESGTDYLKGMASSVLGGLMARSSPAVGGVISQAIAGSVAAGSAAFGISVNPFLFMVFQQPNFKEFSFSWTFAPKNERESEILRNIINEFKDRSLPGFAPFTGGLVLDYPDVVLMKFLPNDIFGNLKFKPCAITSVMVDYTGAGPSFFKDRSGASNGKPTIVNLTVNFKEIQIWFRGQNSGAGGFF